MSKHEPISGQQEKSSRLAPKTGPAQSSGELLSSYVKKFHQTIGNKNVQQLFRGILQPQLTISDPVDPLEREADHVADQVINHPVAAPGDEPPPADEEQRSAPRMPVAIHRQAEKPYAPPSPSSDALLQRIEAARSGGQELPQGQRKEMESRFGADFSKVRIHNDPAAHELSRNVGARAFTIGSNIFFGQNQFNTESKTGKHLLAHELTHTIQQGASRPLARSRSGVLNTSGAGPRPAARGIQTFPVVTAVVGPAAIGVKKSIQVTANAGPVNWALVGAPAGIGITPVGAKKATITAAAGAAAAAGGTFKAKASLTAAPGDSALSGPILIVDVKNITFAANPPFANQPTFGPPAVFPPNTVDPNRDGYGLNTAVATAVTVPAARPATFALAGGGAAGGATVVTNIVTPGAATGFINVKASDTATGAFVVKQLAVNPVPVKLVKLLPQTAVFFPAQYGAQNQLTFKSSDTTVNPLNRVVGETITVQQDPFGIVINAGAGGPNPAPIAALSAPANGWFDNLKTGFLRGAGANMPGVVAGQDPMDINNYLGPGTASTLPRIWILRQGFHHRSWAGFWSNEFDHGIHRRSLKKVGATVKFVTEQIFPGAVSKVQSDPYAGAPFAVPVPAAPAPPLIVLSAVTATPAVPAATALAADGVATAQVTVVTTVPGRNVNWLATGPIAFTVPALGAAAPVATPATVKAGLVPGNFPVQVRDSIFVNREAKGNVKVVPVQLQNIAAAPSPVPVGTLLTTISVNAKPGGRTLLATVDPAAAAAGVVTAILPPAVPKNPPRQVTVTRPAAFTGFVTVTLRDNVRQGEKATIKVKFL